MHNEKDLTDYGIGWAIIGTPDGMQTKNSGCISNFDIGSLVDINNLVIMPFEGSDILCVYKENRGSSFITYYIFYRFAKEINTDRPGTFYGSVLVVVNNFVRGDIAFKFLKETSKYIYL